MSYVHSVLQPCPTGRRGPETNRGPRPDGDEGLESADLPARGRKVRCHRQRIDMTSPATMAPKPIAKFHADNVNMNGILSPAT